MSEERIAVYPGSFDPPTNGHLQLIKLGARLFDHLLVLVGTNPGKTPWFTAEERVSLLKRSIGTTIGLGQTNIDVEILPANVYTAVYASMAGVGYLLRGLRNGMDFEAEHDMQELNAHIGNVLPLRDLQTVFLSLDMHSRVLSSSNVKALVGPEHWGPVVRGLVPTPVLEALERRQQRADRS